MISVCHVLVPTSIQVFNIGSVTGDNIQLYFEHTRSSGGGEIKQFTVNERHGYAIIEFYDPQGQYFVFLWQNGKMHIHFVNAVVMSLLDTWM